MDRRFWFRLALALGKSVRQCQQEIDSQEFSEWLAYYQIEPFGQERDNLHAAMIASMVANAAGGKTKIKDFMLKIRETVHQQTAKQMESILKMFTGWFNGAQNKDESQS